MTRTVVLIDGEHYPPVTAQALSHLRADGYNIVAAVFAGGGEKLSRSLTLDVPLVREADAEAALRSALAQHRPDVVFELSDDPVVDHRMRMRLVAIAIAHEAVYEAPGFRIEPPRRPIVTSLPSIAVIGSGKRCGKTAVSAHVARTLKAAGINPVVVAMGRGGPEKPVVVRGDLTPPDAARLADIAEAGEHAASDVYEDAVVAGVAVVGARRAGAGPSGTTAFDTVADAVVAAESLGQDILILEGSGTSIPPVRADATILVVRDTDEAEDWPISHRILLADLVVVRIRLEKVNQTQRSALASQLRDQAPVVSVSLRPTPMGSVAGRRIFVVTTAPAATGDAIREHLADMHGAEVVGVSHHLADRSRLADEMSAAMGTYDVLVCELKAAAVDVAVRSAHAAGAEVVFLDNRPEDVEGNVQDAIMNVAQQAQELFARR